MSVSDPLIKELKGYVIELFKSEKPITDETIGVQELCECIERIYNYGLIVPRTRAGFIHTPTCWYWMDQISNEKYGGPYSYISCVEKIRRSTRCETHIGKLRQLIRLSLNRRCIHYPVQYLRKDHRCDTFYSRKSIVGDEILSELFLSAALLLSKLEFKLDGRNCLFLDKTWILPRMISLNLVPTRTLGITVSFIGGLAVIMSVIENSIAAECGEIQVGDIIAELNGVTIDENMDGALMNLMRKNYGQPLDVQIVKAVYNDAIFPHIGPFLRKVGLSADLVLAQYQANKNAESPEDQIFYMGQVSTGARGDVKRIFFAINELINDPQPMQPRPVSILCQDLSVRVVATDDDEILFEHSYMEISSCGSSTSGPLYFAYIAGDKNLSDCKNFQCFVFHSPNHDQVESLLRTIGQLL